MKQRYQTDVNFTTIEDAKEIADQYHSDVFEKNEGYGANVEKLAELKNTKKSWWFDSGRYKAVLQAIQRVEDLMTETTDDPQAYENLMTAYARLCGACIAYIGNNGEKRTKVGQTRLNTVKSVYANAEREVLMLQMLYAERGGDFSGGATSFRRLHAGEGIPQEIKSDAAAFSLGDNGAQPATARAGAYELRLQADEFRQKIAEETGTVDGNSNTIAILLEFYQRILGGMDADPDSEQMLPEILTRIKELCMEKKNSRVMTTLIREVDNVLQETGAKIGESDAADLLYRKGFHGTRIEEENIADDLKAASQDQFSDYPLLTDREVHSMADDNRYNTEEVSEKIYGRGGFSNDRQGYVMSGNSFDINRYLRDLDFDSVSYESHNTIGLMDEAAKQNKLPHKARFYRMLKPSYLAGALQLGDYVDGESCKKGMVQAINKKAGTVVTDSGYMSVGYQIDNTFGHYPVMLTLLCDEGMPLMATKNFGEAEFIFPRNTSYMILGARMQEKRSTHMISTLGKMKLKGYYDGIEIICKVMNPAKA